MKNNRVVIACAALVSLVVIVCTIIIIQKQNKVLEALNAENNAKESEKARVKEILENRGPLGFQSKQAA